MTEYIMKARCWQDLVDDINGNPWRLGYNLVTRKIGALQKPFSLKAEQMDRIGRGLFPAHPVQDDDVGAKSPEEYPLFSIRELEKAVPSMKSKKGRGPNGILTEVYKLKIGQAYRSAHSTLA